jgi:O-antigen ligase
MIRARWIVELSVFAIFTLLALYALTPLHPFGVVLLLLAPLVCAFVLPGAARTLYVETPALFRSFTWWQGVWLLMLISGLVFRVRAVQDINAQPLDAWAMFRICVEGVVGVILIGRLVSARTPWLRTLFQGLIGVMTAFALVDITSTAWSVKPLWTFYKSTEYLVDLSLVSALITTLSSTEELERFANWTWTLLGFLLFTSWIGAIIDPADALEGGHTLGPLHARLTGLIPNLASNTVGELSAILGIVALYRMLDDPDKRFSASWYRLLFVASVVTLIFSQTRSAIGAFIFAVMILLFLTRRVLIAAVVAGLGAFCATILVAFTDVGNVIWAYLLRGQSAEQAEGLTGRVVWWHYGMQKFMDHPWRGYGAFAGGRFVILPGLGRISTPDLHSTIVESLVDTGIWGTSILLIAVLGIWWCLYRAIRSPQLTASESRLAVELLSVMAVISVRCVMSSDIIDHPALAFFTVLCGAEFMRRRLKHVNPGFSGGRYRTPIVMKA